VDGIREVPQASPAWQLGAGLRPQLAFPACNGNAPAPQR
jgi:hypothetical protein